MPIAEEAANTAASPRTRRPQDDMQIAVGVKVADVADSTVFENILAVRPLAPADVAAHYEIDQVG